MFRIRIRGFKPKEAAVPHNASDFLSASQNITFPSLRIHDSQFWRTSGTTNLWNYRDMPPAWQNFGQYAIWVIQR